MGRRGPIASRAAVYRDLPSPLCGLLTRPAPAGARSDAKAKGLAGGSACLVLPLTSGARARVRERFRRRKDGGGGHDARRGCGDVTTSGRAASHRHHIPTLAPHANQLSKPRGALLCIALLCIALLVLPAEDRRHWVASSVPRRRGASPVHTYTHARRAEYSHSRPHHHHYHHHDNRAARRLLAFEVP